CMQACPYDALYIDPGNHTAAKCNYCAHRVDVGLEPACVNVCPEHAIISGDMDDPQSEIANLLARQPVKVRKAEKGTQPNLFYIDADELSLNPTATNRSEDYFWSSQGLGVGHFAKEAEKMAFSNGDVLQTLMTNQQNQISGAELADRGAAKSVDVLLGKGRRAYDAPDKGILWAWEVAAYVWTKAIATGIFLVPFLAWLLGETSMKTEGIWWILGIGMGFLALTGLLLVKDLDRPDRFLSVLLRPQWNSWLVKGGYAITVYGGLLALLVLTTWMEWIAFEQILMWATAALAVLVAVYTAFLFAQAKGRDFWQSPTLVLHMLVHSLMAGAAVLAFLVVGMENGESWLPFLNTLALLAIAFNLAIMLVELTITHPTEDAKRTVDLILRGPYRQLYWGGAIVLGNVIPFIVICFVGLNAWAFAISGVLILLGIYITEHIWVEAPQRLPLS
ncbi:MAG: NrfD/PsrC family molybdoenzyme membrane anchor subunit, partial [Bacteroidota bacterium]